MDPVLRTEEEGVKISAPPPKPLRSHSCPATPRYDVITQTSADFENIASSSLQDGRNSSQDERNSSQDGRHSCQDERNSSQDGRHSSQDGRHSSQDRRHSSQDERNNSRDREISLADDGKMKVCLPKSGSGGLASFIRSSKQSGRLKEIIKPTSPLPIPEGNNSANDVTRLSETNDKDVTGLSESREGSESPKFNREIDAHTTNESTISEDSAISFNGSVTSSVLSLSPTEIKEHVISPSSEATTGFIISHDHTAPTSQRSNPTSHTQTPSEDSSKSGATFNERQNQQITPYTPDSSAAIEGTDSFRDNPEIVSDGISKRHSIGEPKSSGGNALSENDTESFAEFTPSEGGPPPPGGNPLSPSPAPVCRSLSTSTSDDDVIDGNDDVIAKRSDDVEMKRKSVIKTSEIVEGSVYIKKFAPPEVLYIKEDSEASSKVGVQSPPMTRPVPKPRVFRASESSAGSSSPQLHRHSDADRIDVGDLKAKDLEYENEVLKHQIKHLKGNRTDLELENQILKEHLLASGEFESPKISPVLQHRMYANVSVPIPIKPLLQHVSDPAEMRPHSVPPRPKAIPRDRIPRPLSIAKRDTTNESQTETSQTQTKHTSTQEEPKTAPPKLGSFVTSQHSTPQDSALSSTPPKRPVPVPRRISQDKVLRENLLASAKLGVVEEREPQSSSQQDTQLGELTRKVTIDNEISEASFEQSKALDQMQLQEFEGGKDVKSKSSKPSLPYQRSVSLQDHTDGKSSAKRSASKSTTPTLPSSSDMPTPSETPPPTPKSAPPTSVSPAPTSTFGVDQSNASVKKPGYLPDQQPGVVYKKIAIKSDSSWIKKGTPPEKQKSESNLSTAVHDITPNTSKNSDGASKISNGGLSANSGGERSDGIRTPSPNQPPRPHAPYRSHAIVTAPQKTATIAHPGTSYLPPAVPRGAIPPPKIVRGRGGTTAADPAPKSSTPSHVPTSSKRRHSFTRSSSDDSIAAKVASSTQKPPKKPSPPRRRGPVPKLPKSSGESGTTASTSPKKPARGGGRGRKGMSASMIVGEEDSRPVSMLVEASPKAPERLGLTQSCSVNTLSRDITPDDVKKFSKGRSKDGKDSDSPKLKKGLFGRIRNKYPKVEIAPPLEEIEEGDAMDSSSEDEKGGTIKSMPRLRHVSIKRSISIDEDADSEYHQLFEYVFVVKLKKVSEKSKELTTELSYTFPPNPGREFKGKDLALLAIPQFCFPDIDQWKPTRSYRSEKFSFVLTDIEGNRRFGYCRRLLPVGSGPRLPEVYCIVSPLGCFSLYEKILDHVENRRAVSSSAVFTFLKAIVANPFPRPGRSVEVRAFAADGSGMETVSLARPLDSRLEHVDFSVLFKTLSPRKVIQLFSSLLMERRVVLCAHSLSLLSGCAHALMALLYPFQWQHVFIPVLPNNLIDFVCSPLPFIIGINPACIKLLDDLELDEVVVIDLEKSKFVRKIGDETSILPNKLFQFLEHSLGSSVISSEFRKSPSHRSGRADEIIVNTFLTFFVYLYGNYSQYMKVVNGGTGACELQRSDFVKQFSSKSIKRFLEAFHLSQMFENFIEERENPIKRETAAQSMFEKNISIFKERSQEIEIFSSKSGLKRWKLAKKGKK